jgi:hypothetical protein
VLDLPGVLVCQDKAAGSRMEVDQEGGVEAMDQVGNTI